MIRLIVNDPSLRTPEIEQWLKNCEKVIQPIIEKAMELARHDLLAYGAQQRTPEEYVKEAMR